MAGDWIKMCIDLPRHPAVLKISHRCGIESDAVVGKLLRVWAWAGAHTSTGRIEQATADTVDEVANKPGFALAMQEAGWLRLDPARGAFLPNWKRHNGSCAKQRALGAQRASRARHANSVTKRAPTARAAESREREYQELESSNQEPDADEARPPHSRSKRAVVAAVPNESQMGVCSVLMTLRDQGERLFDNSAAAAISMHPNACRMQVTWALERLKQMASRKNPIRNRAGLLRDLIENKTPPDGWVARFQKGEFARLSRERDVTREMPAGPENPSRAV